MAKAFRIALSGRPGPVFLELAWDVLCNGVDEATLQIPRLYRTRARQAPDPKGVEEALALLAAAERPAMIAGSSIWWDDATDALRAFVEPAQIPTYLNGAGRGCLPPDHPMFFQHTRKEALTGADVVFNTTVPPGVAPFLEQLHDSGFGSRGGKLVCTYFEENLLGVLPPAHVEGLYSCLDYYQTVDDAFSRRLLGQ